MQAVALLVVLALLALIIWQYNAVIGLRQLTRNAWADVDVYLKRRAELIPNLVAAVKGYASHEQTLLEALAQARTEALAQQGPSNEKAVAEGAVGSRLAQTLILAESYPDLKSSESFNRLQEELTDTEKMIASARQYYNACVRDLNTKIEAFPSSIVAAMIGAKHESYFELDAAQEREAPRLGG